MGAPDFLAGETLAASQLKLQTTHRCTSSTRPGSPFEGLQIWETDTDRYYFYTGSAWRYLAGGTDPTAARAFASAATSISTAADTAIALATESYDYGSIFAASTYTVPRDGLLDVRGRVSVAAPSAGQRLYVSIYVAGAEAVRGIDVDSPATDPISAVVADVIAVTSGQAVQLRGRLVGGSAANCETGTNLTYLTCSMRP